MRTIKTILSSILIISSLFVVLEKTSSAENIFKEKEPRPQNEFSVSVGIGPFMTLWDGFEHWDGPVDGCGNHSNSLDYTIGFEYFRYLNRHIAIGGSINHTYGHYTYNDWMDYWWSSDSEYKTTLYHGCGNVPVFYTVALAEVKVPWMYFKHFCLYSKLGFGVWVSHKGAYDYYCSSYRHIEGTPDKYIEVPDHLVSDGEFNSDYSIQATLVGLDFGNGSYRGFVEFGLGDQGVIFGGFRYSF